MTPSAECFLDTLHAALRRTEVTDAVGASVPLEEGIRAFVARLHSVKKAAGKVMLIGNGGSAAIASHVQNDLCKCVGVRALVLTEPPLLMAMANDDGYETVFEQTVRLWAEPRDLLVAISSGGRSPNILRGVGAALDGGCPVVTLSGFGGDNPLRRLGALNFYVPAAEYGYVELGHSVLLHLVTDRAAAGGPMPAGRHD